MVIDIKPHLSSHRLGGRLLRIGAIGIVLAAMGATNSSAAEDPQFPGLPRSPEIGSWVDTRTTSLNYVEATRQWIRPPRFSVKAYSEATTYLADPLCVRLRPFRASAIYSADLHFVSSKGAPDPYGHVGPFAVRTVAFGGIPVEAEVALRQQRDAENLPIGLEFTQTLKRYCRGLGPNAGPTEEEALSTNTTVNGQLEVAITSLKVDGVDLRLTDACRTGSPSTINLSSPDHLNLDPTLEPEDHPAPENIYTTKFFNAIAGGLLTGTIDIPAFAGCVTETGEDVSRLLTTTVSGKDNPVIIRSEGVATATVGDRSEPFDPLPFPTQAP